MLRIAIIIGSAREGRFAPRVAEWFAGQVSLRDDVELDMLDIAEEFSADRVAAADAFVVVVPEYNHSFPGPLKTAIDRFHGEWQAKPIGFVSYGGISGGLRAVEGLRLVFAELHAVGIRDTVCFPNYWNEFDEAGAWPKAPEQAEGATKLMIDQLVWWAEALRAAREARPYGVRHVA